MTDLKMCDYRLYYVNKEGPHWEWTPIEPQPCCENCGGREWCLLIKFIEDMGRHLDYYFCREWVAKQ
jgi:hypothetical protein